MKKTLISIVAVAFVALMIATVYAPREIPEPTIRAPTFCGCPPDGFTPGFWKHNIRVRLSHAPYPYDITNAAYNAFDRPNKDDDLDGVKLTDTMMDGFLDDINDALDDGHTFEEFLGYLELPGWHPDRTNTANWFNKVAGYGEF